jgi:hypothetical protein
LNQLTLLSAAVHCHDHAEHAVLPASSSAAGEMSDAGELLLVLYEHLKAAAAEAGASVDAVFGLRVAEAVLCGQCGMETQGGQYVQVGACRHC